MQEFKMYRIYGPAEKVVIKELVRRVDAERKPLSKSQVLNEMLIQFPKLMEQLKRLSK